MKKHEPSIWNVMNVFYLIYILENRKNSIWNSSITMLGHVLFNKGRGNILLKEGEREVRFELVLGASDICHAHVSLWSFGMNNSCMSSAFNLLSCVSWCWVVNEWISNFRVRLSSNKATRVTTSTSSTTAKSRSTSTEKKFWPSEMADHLENSLSSTALREPPQLKRPPTSSYGV